MRALLSLLVLLTAIGPAAAADARGLLRVGLDPRSAPWAWVPGLPYDGDFTDEPALDADALAKLTGIDVEVSRAIGRLLGRPIEIVPVSYFRLEEALVSGEIDLIVNAWNATPETPEGISATGAYYGWGLLLAVRDDDPRIRDYASLEGMRVGYFQSRLVLRTLHSLGAHLQVYRSEERLFADLRNQSLDAVIYDSPAVRWRAAHGGGLRVVGEPLNRLGYCVAVRHGEPELLRDVDAAVADLVASGESERIRRRWEESR